MHPPPAGSEPFADVPLARVTRSRRVESVHRGSVAVVRLGDDGAPELLAAHGDVHARVHCRSATKFAQALPLVEQGIADRLGLDERHLALTCASHAGGPEHVAVATEILAKGGLGECDLGCGPHAPLGKAERLALARTGAKPTRLHNNCSGKHGGFLLLAQAMGQTPADALDPEGPSQRLVRETVCALAGADPGDAPEELLAVDGCGAPTFRLPLVGLATLLARFANPDGLPAVRRRACRRLLAAFTAHPELLAGPGRLCSALVASAPGRVAPKNGAEGVYTLGLPGLGIGLAVKVSDGAERGYLPVVVQALGELGLWSEVPSELLPFGEVPVLNTQKLRVGEVTSMLGRVLTAPAGGADHVNGAPHAGETRML